MNRNKIIDWLETNRNNGFFDGFAEENMDFTKLDDNELNWYYENWIKPDQKDEIEDYTKKGFKLNSDGLYENDEKRILF